MKQFVRSNIKIKLPWHLMETHTQKNPEECQTHKGEDHVSVTHVLPPCGYRPLPWLLSCGAHLARGGQSCTEPGKLEMCVVSCQLAGAVFVAGAFGKKEGRKEG